MRVDVHLMCGRYRRLFDCAAAAAARSLPHVVLHDICDHIAQPHTCVDACCIDAFMVRVVGIACKREERGGAGVLAGSNAYSIGGGSFGIAEKVNAMRHSRL